MKKKIFLGVFIITAVYIFGFLGVQNASAACTIKDVLWKINGVDYTKPPGNLIIGQKVQAWASFVGCGSSGNPVTITLISSSGIVNGATTTTNLGGITNNVFEQKWVEVVLPVAGQFYFTVNLKIGSAEYTGKSEVVTVVGCEPKLTFDANPKKVDSVSQTIKLSAKVSTEGMLCAMAPASIKFSFYYGSGKLIKTEMSDSSPLYPYTVNEERTIDVSPSSLGYSANDVASFYVKAEGAALGSPDDPSIFWGPISSIVNLKNSVKTIDQQSSVVCVGIGKDPVCANVSPSPSSVASASSKYNFSIDNPIGISSFQDLVNIIGKWIFNLAIPIAVIMIIWGGVQMLTAGAFPDQFKKGQTTLKWAVIGLAIVLIGKGFVTLIQSILSLKK